MDDDCPHEVSDAIDRACVEMRDRDPEQVARFDAQIEHTEQALGSGLFERAHETVEVTYERAEPAPTRDWNDLSPALQQRILDAVERTRRGETVDLGDFSQYADDGAAASE